MSARGCTHGRRASEATRPPAAAGKDEVAPRVADQRAAAARRRVVVPLDRLPVRHPGRGQLAPDERLREGEPGEQRLEEEPTRVAVGGREPGVDGHRAGERRRVRDRLHQPVERGDPRIVRREREAPEAGRRIRLRPLEGRCEVIGALAARRVRGAVVRIAADLLVRHFRVPEKMPGRVHADQNGAVDALRVPPGVDQRRARTGALAQQVDLPVPEGRPDRLEVVDLIGQPVAVQIDTAGLQPCRARPKAAGVGPDRLLAEEVLGALQRRDDLGAIEPNRAVDAAVADEDDVMVLGDATCLRELHVRDARPAFEPEDRRARMGRARLDAGDGQGDQPRVRIGPVLRDDERPAVRRVAAPLRAVVARREVQLAGLRPGRDGDRVAAGGQAEVREPQRQHGDEHEPGDPRLGQSTLRLAGAALGRCRLGLRLVDDLELSVVEVRQPLEPRGEVPVPLAEQLHRRGEQDAPDDRRVDQDRRGEPDAELLEEQHRQRREDREHADHHDRRAGDDARRRADPVRDRLVHRVALLEPLADPADDEHVIVHREAEQDHEQEQRDHGRDAGGRGEAEEALADPVLEDQHQDPVGRRDGQAVEHDRLGRDHDRAERDQHQQEREHEHERDHERQCRPDLVAAVRPLGGQPGDACLDVRHGADRLRDQRLAQELQRVVRRVVRAVAVDRHGDVRDRAGLVDVDRDRLVRTAARKRPPLEVRDRRSHGRRVDVRCLDDHVRGQRRPGERHLHPLVRLDYLEVRRIGVRRGLRHPHLDRGQREQQEQAAGDRRGERRAAQDAVDDPAPHAALAAGRTPPAEPAAVDAVAEPREQRRQDGERPEHGDRDDHHRRDAERGERLVAGDEHAAHRDHHGQA